MTTLRHSLLLLALLPALAHGQTPADLALIPGDAYGFMHLKVSDLWKHELMKNARDLVAAAGPKALGAYEKQVYPNPSDFDRLTVILVPGKNPQGPPDVVVVATFKNAIDLEKLHTLYLPESKAQMFGGKKCYIDADRDMAVCSMSGQHLLAGPAKSVEAFLARKTGASDGPLATAIATASTKALTVAVNVKALPIPPNAYDQIPPDVRPLAMAEKILFAIDITAADPTVELKAMYASDAAATDAEKGLKAAIMMGKQAMKQSKAEMEQKLFANENKGPQKPDMVGELTGMLLGLGGINRLEQELDKLPIVRAGNAMTATVVVPKEATGMLGFGTPVAIGLLLPAVQKVRMAAGNSQSMNNMKQIGLALHNVNDSYGKMPGAAICSKDGKPLLSWRVHILPYMEHDNLYRQFKLDEPWDSPTNKPLIKMMPKIYGSPRYPLAEGETCYKVFVGPEAIFEVTKGRPLQAIPDGTSNTVMAVEAGDPVIWTKPDDIPFDSKKDLPKLELPGGLKDINVLMGDGSCRRVNLDKISAKTWKIVIGAADGDLIPGDWNGDDAPPTTRVEPARKQSFPIKPSSAAPPVPVPGKP